jgi:hypothetical protein
VPRAHADVNPNAIHREVSAVSSVSAIRPVAVSTSSTPTRSDAPAPPPRAPVRAAELPEAPKPLTPATTAVHIMKVPTSRIVEAFALLERARGQQSAQTVRETPASKPAWPAPAPAPRRRIDLEA